MLLFLIIISVILIVLIIRGVFLSRKKRLALYDSFISDFGKKRKKQYYSGKAHRRAILDRFSCECPIDDITWNDLDMESVFERIDRCKSAIGEEYLYYLLHNVSSVKDEAGLETLETLENLENLETMVSAFSGDEKTRTDLLMSLNRLGYIKNLSPFDYLDSLTGGKAKSPVKHILLDILFIPAIALIFFKPLFGGIAVFIVIVINILLYFREKSVLDGISQSIGFLIRLSDEGCKLSEKDYPCINEDISKLRENEKLLKELRRGGRYLSVSGQSINSTSGGPAEILLTYVNMVFHIDLIQYSLLLGKLSGKKKIMEDLLLLFGRIDAAISIADFRASLGDNWCKPSFNMFDGSDRKSLSLKLDNGCHPLIDEPVPNSISVSRGVLLTGSNASGKSTFLRMVAINAILAQTIGTVCASEYKAPKFHIFSSIALKDDLAGKESYFMVEIRSVKRIIDTDCSKVPVLCFIDEVLRGTNTVERISASDALLKFFARRNILCFAATHDGELADLLEDTFDNYHFGEDISETDVKFDYKLQKGKASTRNAIKLLEVFGYPPEIVSESEKMARKLDAKE